MAEKNEVEKYFYDLLENNYNEQSLYDYLVLYSGGKDSTYLAHTMKQCIGGRVCLFTVDNGFENDETLKQIKNNAIKLGCDLYIYQQPPVNFLTYYNFLITEPALRTIDSNPLCLFCNRYFMALGVEFAERLNIPIVVHGATAEQLSKGIVSKSLADIMTFETVAKLFFERAHKKIRQMERYKSDNTVK